MSVKSVKGLVLQRAENPSTLWRLDGRNLSGEVRAGWGGGGGDGGEGLRFIIEKV